MSGKKEEKTNKKDREIVIAELTKEEQTNLVLFNQQENNLKALISVIAGMSQQNQVAKNSFINMLVEKYDIEEEYRDRLVVKQTGQLIVMPAVKQGIPTQEPSSPVQEVPKVKSEDKEK